MRPSPLAVRSSRVLKIKQIVPLPPTACHQLIAQLTRLVYRLHIRPALSRTDVQPQTRPATVDIGPQALQHHLAIPPDRRRHNRQPPKDVRRAKPQVKRHQPAQRTAAHRRMAGVGLRAILAVDPGLQFLDNQTAVSFGQSAVLVAQVHGRRVFVDALRTGMVNAHDDQRLYLARPDQRIGRRFHMPDLARHKRPMLLEKILPVVQIEHRIARLAFVISVRRVNRNLALGQKLRLPPRHTE